MTLYFWVLNAIQRTHILFVYDILHSITSLTNTLALLLPKYLIISVLNRGFKNVLFLMNWNHNWDLSISAILELIVFFW